MLLKYTLDPFVPDPFIIGDCSEQSIALENRKIDSGMLLGPLQGGIRTTEERARDTISVDFFKNHLNPEGNGLLKTF